MSDRRAAKKRVRGIVVPVLVVALVGAMLNQSGCKAEEADAVVETGTIVRALIPAPADQRDAEDAHDSGGVAQQDPAQNARGRPSRARCLRNLKVLGVVFTLYQVDHLDGEEYDGVAMFLHLRARDRELRDVLICPGDPAAVEATEAARPDAYEDVDLTAPPDDLCSYAVRDFTNYPLSRDSDSPQIVASDRMGRDGRTPHHEDGLCVLFDDGRAVFMDRSALGLSASDPIVVGPKSSHPLLRKLVYIPDRQGR